MDRPAARIHLVPIAVLIAAACAHDRPPRAAAAGFDPDGYYVPARELAVAGLRFENVELSTTASADASAARRDPRPGTAWLTLATVGQDRQRAYACALSIIDRDRVRFVCGDTPLGTIAFAGSFLDTRRDQTTRARPRSGTLAMRGRLVIGRGGVALFDGDVDWRYSEKD